MLFREMAGRISGDRYPIAGAEDESVHWAMSDKRAEGLPGGIAICRIVGDRDIETPAVLIIEDP